MNNHVTMKSKGNTKHILLYIRILLYITGVCKLLEFIHAVYNKKHINLKKHINFETF